MLNPMQIMSMYQQLRQNPISLLSQTFNVPQNLNSPQEIIQHLLNTNQISQDQVNQARAMQNSPLFNNMK